MMNFRFSAILTAVLFITWGHLSHGADAEKKHELSPAAEKRLAREKRYLSQTIDELERSISYVNEDIAGIGDQIDAVMSLKSERRENDLWSLLAWHHNFADWLTEQSAEFEYDLSLCYSESTCGREWTGRYRAAVVKYKGLEGRLREMMKQSEEERREIEKTVDNRVLELLKLQRAKDLKDNEDKGKSEEDRRKVEAELQNQLADLKELLKHHDILIEKEKAGLDWLTMKINDWEALSEAALLVGGPASRQLESAYNRIIRVYESDISRLSRRSDELDRQKDLKRTVKGTLKELDRSRELLDFFDRTKDRYYHHIGWLKTQITGYRADITEMWKEK